ncbi:MAG: hypothetical protein HND47_20415 [Chloroflexi bacterium]|nr:hypothetical protein [Chloroflexota bacterium]
MPPANLLPEGEGEGVVALKYLLVDTGLAPGEVSKRVRIGDRISFGTEPAEMSGGCVSGHTLDNRASVAALTICLEELAIQIPRVGCMGAGFGAGGNHARRRANFHVPDPSHHRRRRGYDLRQRRRRGRLPDLPDWQRRDARHRTERASVFVQAFQGSCGAYRNPRCRRPDARTFLHRRGRDATHCGGHSHDGREHPGEVHAHRGRTGGGQGYSARRASAG